jgi:hypothetical protein
VRRDVPPPADPSRSAPVSCSADMDRAGTSAAMIAATAPATTAASNTLPFSRTSSRNGVPCGAMAASPGISTQARPTPAVTPTAASTTPSMSNCCRSRPRLAPSDSRTASSRARPEPRTSARFATFAHAINSTPATAPSSTYSASEVLASTMYSRSGTRVLVQPRRSRGWSRSRRAAIYQPP